MALTWRQIDRDAGEEIPRCDPIVLPAVASGKVPTHRGELRENEQGDDPSDRPILTQDLHDAAPGRSL